MKKTLVAAFLCASSFAWAQPASAGSFSGQASYYGGSDGLCGSKTANGERHNCRAMTAAHKTLPMGTHVHCTHRGHSVTVRINDRGPYAHGRVIDFSPAAARAIGMGGTGHVSCSY